MEAIAISSGPAPSRTTGTTSPVSELTSEDFFKLLILELQNQDPLEPMDNAQLLDQISSVREIELNATLTESLRSLSGQQRFASASSLIGQYVTTRPDGFGNEQSGVVVSVRFSADSKPILQLADGREVAMENIERIEPPLKAAEALMGQTIVGLDRRDVMNPTVVEGLVTGVRIDSLGEAILELDGGSDLRFKDVMQIAAIEAA